MKFRNAYCTYSALEEIYLFNKDHSELFKILTQECQLSIDLTLDQLSDQLNKSIALKSFYKISGKIKPSPEKFNCLDNYLDSSELTGSIVIANISKATSQSIRQKFAILAISAQCLEEFKSLIVPASPWSWGKGDKKKYDCPTGKKYFGWGAIIRPFMYRQSLSVANLIINDDYLLKSDDDWVIAKNIFSITKGFLTDNLSTEMHVLVVAGSSKPDPGGFNYNVSKIDSILQKLNTLKAEIKSHTVKYGILTHEINNHNSGALHERFIIADYSIATSNWGFLEFAEDEAKRENDLNYQWIFYNILNENGSDIPLKKIQKKLEAIKQLKNTNQRMGSPSTNYFRGNVENRLLDL